MKANNPFFILGNPRSGSTLFRLMLHHHPEMVVPPECGFIEWWYEKFGNWTEDDLWNGKVEEFVRDLSKSKKIETWNLDYEWLLSSIKNNQPHTYASLCQIVYLVYAYQKGKENVKRWGDKNNYFIHHLEKLNTIFPKAQYILIVRDGRDVACSYLDVNKLQTSSVYKPVLPSSIKDISKEWNNNHKVILSFFKRLNQTKSLIVRYEDLVRQTENVLREVCAFLRIDYSSKMLNYFGKNEDVDAEPNSLLDWKRKTLNKPDVKKHW